MVFWMMDYRRLLFETTVHHSYKKKLLYFWMQHCLMEALKFRNTRNANDHIAKELRESTDGSIFYTFSHDECVKMSWSGICNFTHYTPRGIFLHSIFRLTQYNIFYTLYSTLHTYLQLIAVSFISTTTTNNKSREEGWLCKLLATDDHRGGGEGYCVVVEEEVNKGAAAAAASVYLWHYALNSITNHNIANATCKVVFMQTQPFSCNNTASNLQYIYWIMMSI